MNSASKSQIFKVYFDTASNQLQAFGHIEKCGNSNVSKNVISREKFYTQSRRLCQNIVCQIGLHQPNSFKVNQFSQIIPHFEGNSMESLNLHSNLVFEVYFKCKNLSADAKIGRFRSYSRKLLRS